VPEVRVDEKKKNEWMVCTWRVARHGRSARLDDAVDSAAMTTQPRLLVHAEDVR